MKKSLLCLIIVTAWGCADSEPPVAPVSPNPTTPSNPATPTNPNTPTNPTNPAPSGNCPDRDLDGYQDATCNSNAQAGGGDCNDTNNLVNPGRMENCGNLIDNNCNGLLPDREPSCSAGCEDMDGDGYQNATCNGDRNNRGGDCNDMDPTVNPGAMERCGNQRDDDCMGGDLPCLPNCTDMDNDGFGLGAGCRGPDCNDRDERVNPWRSEICGNNIDEDCSGRDLVCPTMDCVDRDRDGYGVGAGCLGTDCNDNDSTINPGAVEVIGDNVDQDCNGRDLIMLQNCTDVDQDGYGVGTGCLGQDCDDSDPRIHPTRTEICGNGRDDDCSRGDQVCVTQQEGECMDMDGDGHGPGRCLRSSADCNDMNPDINPFAEETCNNIDDDCDMKVDECPLMNQTCNGTGPNAVCVGRVGSPCSSDMNCAQDMGLICDLERGQCRVAAGQACVNTEDCVSSAECAENTCAEGRVCYQRQGASCEGACDCTGQLQCNSLNNVCVECSADSDCTDGICSEGGFCMTEETVESVDQMLRVLVDCYGTYRGSTEDRGCAKVTVSASLMDYEQMTISSIPDAEGLEGLICDSDGSVAASFGGGDYDILKELFGCGLFDIFNVFWENSVPADSEICVYYAPTKSGFNFPVRERTEVVVVDRCRFSRFD